MTYALIKNGKVAEYPVYEGDIRLRFPNVSFASPFVPPEGYKDVIDAPRPETSHTQNCVDGTPVLDGGQWTRNWVVTNATKEEISSRIDARWTAVRIDRNMRLSSCDWTQLSDAPVNKDEWAVYRQALRDITTQTDPFNIVWPENP